MQSIDTQAILDAEQRLRQAMLASDVAALDALLAPGLIFTNHLGQVIDKQTDLAVHGSGKLRITRIDLSDQLVRVYDGYAVVSVRVTIDASFDGAAVSDTLRFTRIWSLSAEGHWQVTAGHSSAVA